MLRFVASLVLVLMISCAVERPQGKTEAEVLYKEAQDLVKDSRYIMATEKLNTLRSQYPYSYYSTYAELMLADILFMQESYEEAAAAYILFRDFHPKHQRRDYVLYRIAESYFNQRPETYDRDLTSAVQAIKYFNELKSLYPDSKFLKDANLKIEECRKMLIDKEKYIADFYFRTENFESATFRYKSILENYRTYEMKSIAAIRLMKIGLANKDQSLCVDTFNKTKSLLRGKEMKEAQKVFKGCQSIKG